MQQWKYCAIQFAHDQLTAFNFETDRKIQFSPVPHDPSNTINNDTVGEVIRKWTAVLGLQGWELVSVIIIEETNYQEWIFKRPTQERDLSLLWKDGPS